MKTYWNNLNERERWMLGIGASCCFFYLFYWLLYTPLANAVHEKLQQRTEKQQTLLWMQQVRLQDKTRSAPQHVTNSQLLTLLANQLRNTSFHQFPYQLQQTRSGDIELSFEKVPFDLFTIWLESMNRQYALSVKQFNAERPTSPGVVKMLVVLSAK